MVNPSACIPRLPGHCSTSNRMSKLLSPGVQPPLPEVALNFKVELTSFSDPIGDWAACPTATCAATTAAVVAKVLIDILVELWWLVGWLG